MAEEFGFAELNKKPLYEQIADSIEKAIIYNGEQGSRLPSEIALSGQFGVSRTIIREALKLLQARGLVEIRVGGGAYISKPEADDVSELLLRIVQIDRIEDKDVYEMRIILEVAAIREAVNRISESEIDALEVQISEMEKVMSDLQQRIEKDLGFHYLIAKYSGNKMLALMIKTMTGVLSKFIVSTSKVEGSDKDGIYHHRRIVEALRTRDPEIVATAMKEHLDSSWNFARKQMMMDRF